MNVDVEKVSVSHEFWGFRRAAQPIVANTLCLTMDDGPGTRLTPALLDLLDAYDAEATFFLLGRRAMAEPTIVERIVEEGHEVGCHTHDHLNAWKCRPSRVIADIEKGYESLSQWIEPNAAFRPPYGKVTPWSRRAIRRRGAVVAGWTVDSGDTWSVLPVVSDVVDRIKRESGGVVLLHDFDRDGRNGQMRFEFVLRVAEELLRLAIAEGWRICTLSRCRESLRTG